jgi:hypothetical protein
MHAQLGSTQGENGIPYTGKTLKSSKIYKREELEPYVEHSERLSTQRRESLYKIEARLLPKAPLELI